MHIHDLQRMTGDTAVQNQAIAEEGEVEYISDEDEEEHGYQTDRIILPSPRVSVEEHEVGFSSQRNIISAVFWH